MDVLALSIIFHSGDVNSITIGSNVTIGDQALVHCSSGHPTVIGDRVTIGSGAIIHGCHLENECIIGAGAQIMDGARVQTNAMVGAGAVLSKGKVVPTGQCWSGIPAVFERNLSAIEIEAIGELAEETTELAVLHAQENLKTWEMIETELFNYRQETDRSPNYYRRLTDEVTLKYISDCDKWLIVGIGCIISLFYNFSLLYRMMLTLKTLGLQEWSYKLGELENHVIPGRIFDTKGRSKAPRHL